MYRCNASQVQDSHQTLNIGVKNLSNGALYNTFLSNLNMRQINSSRSAPTLSKYGPPHIMTIFLGVCAWWAGDLLLHPRLSLLSRARRAIRFWLSSVYSIAVAHVSENARQRVFPWVSGVRDRPSGCDVNVTDVQVCRVSF